MTSSSNNYKSTVISSVRILHDNSNVIIKSEKKLQCLSSAIVNGGRFTTKQICNHTIKKDFDPIKFENELKKLKESYKLSNDAIVLLTAVEMNHAVILDKELKSIKFILITSAGTTNPCSPQDSPENLYQLGGNFIIEKTPPKNGTINTILIIDAIIPEHVLTNLFIIMTEAKSNVLRNLGFKTKQDNIATGTSTDAIAVGFTNRGYKVEWTGYATEFGYVIGQMVMLGIKKSLVLGGYINE